MSAETTLFDVFISHASEDKESVARPLASALTAAGWTVWLDELQLTVGDSLSSKIDEGLSKCRFGVVVLSPAFFRKAWPQRELAGLAAREIGTGQKVILPVWHKIDHTGVMAHSPVLADRLGAVTSGGIQRVAEELSEALEVGMRSPSFDGLEVDSEKQDLSEQPGLIEIPTTKHAQGEVIKERPLGWEYRLYAGVLLQGRIELEGKWLDHELRLPRGPRQAPDPDEFMTFVSSQLDWARRRIENLNVLFEAEVIERAFGPSGEPGDPERIEHLARGILQIYESMLDWAASLRNVDVPSLYRRVFVLISRMLDGPVIQIRDFIQMVADEIAEIEIKSATATEESPLIIHLTLTLELEDGLEDELDAAFEALAPNA